MLTLPIDSRVAEIAQALRESGALVVQAEPGAGKTTRLPPALLPLVGPSQQVVVLEPRRLAARTAAQRVAAEMGQKVGQTVGTIMRSERRVSAETRLLYVTEAVLTRWLASEPELPGVGAVVFDEVHERNLHSDVALALVQRLRAEKRGDLLLLAMSATLQAEELAAHLSAPAIHCTGRVHPVHIEHQTRPDRDELDVRVAKAVRRLCREGLAGHVLVFLPGAHAIERARARCEAVARDEDLVLCPLHGSLPAEQQDRALAASRRRKVILATNIAETSLTIADVVAVIDSGLAKVASYDRRLQRTRLTERRISQASATQRAGRAGRTAPGRCVRLYSEGDLQRRPAHDTPEIERVDLCGVLLLLFCAGLVATSVEELDLCWLTPPPANAVRAAYDLLCQLGAIDGSGRISETGRRMARLPLHPRLARVVVEAARRKVDDVVVRDIADIVEGTRGGRRGVSRLASQLAAISKRWRKGRAPEQSEDQQQAAMGMAWLHGFPDRVAKRVGREGELALADGGRAVLPRQRQARKSDGGRSSEDAQLGAQGFGVVLEAQERPGSAALVRRMRPVELEWLLEAFGDIIDMDTQLVFNRERDRVEAIDQLRYRGLVLEQSCTVAVAGPDAAAVLFQAAGDVAASLPETQSWLSRVAFAAGHDTVVEPIDQAAVDTALRQLCQTSTSLAELGDLHHVLRGNMQPSGGDAGEVVDVARRVEVLAPAKVRLAAQVELTVHYSAHEPPFVESYLQDFFGLERGPCIAKGQAPLVLRLWAPNARPIQVTSDLASFWQRHYPKLRRQLSRRYPKHHWPEQPSRAQPVRLVRHLS